MKATSELSDSLRGSGLYGTGHVVGGDLETVMVFYEKDREILPSHHNRSLTAHIHDAELRHTLINSGSSLNIMPLSIPEVVEIPRDKIIKQPIKVSDFRDNVFFSLGYINLNLYFLSSAIW